MLMLWHSTGIDGEITTLDAEIPIYWRMIWNWMMLVLYRNSWPYCIIHHQRMLVHIYSMIDHVLIDHLLPTCKSRRGVSMCIYHSIETTFRVSIPTRPARIWCFMTWALMLASLTRQIPAAGPSNQRWRSAVCRASPTPSKWPQFGDSQTQIYPYEYLLVYVHWSKPWSVSFWGLAGCSSRQN